METDVCMYVCMKVEKWSDVRGVSLVEATKKVSKVKVKDSPESLFSFLSWKWFLLLGN